MTNFDITQRLNIGKGRIHYMVEPITVVMAAIAAIASYVRDQNLQNHLEDINTKHDQVLRICGSILDQLKALEILIPQALEDQYRNVLVRNLERHRMNYKDDGADVLRDGALSKDVSERLEEQFLLLKSTTYDLIVCGYAVYPGVVVGASLLFSIATTLKPSGKLSLAYMESVYQQLRKYFVDAVSTDIGESIAMVRKRRESEQAGYWTKLITFPRSGFLGALEGDDGGRGSFHDKVAIWQCFYLTLQGNPPAALDSRQGFRFGGVGMADQAGFTEWNERGWFEYATIVPTINTRIGSDNAAQDETAKVLATVNAIADARDITYLKYLGLLNSEIAISQSIIPTLDDIWKAYAV